MAKNQTVDMLNNPKRSLPERHKEKPFTKKQQAFIQHYVYHDLTNTEAAHRAGYSNPRQIAYVLLNDPRYMNVQMKIRELQEAQQKKYEITFEKVARDLQMIRDRAVEDGSYGAAVTAELGRAQYYLVDYPRKGCRNCGRDALLITDNRSPKKITRNKLTSES